MKKIILFTLTALLVFSMASCAFIPDEDDLSNILNNLTENITDKITSNLPAAEIKETTNTPSIAIYNDKLVITIKSDEFAAAFEENAITVESIKKEQANAKAANMAYDLKYQYITELKINEAKKTFISNLTVTTDNLYPVIEITIPVDTADMSVTVYNLLNGDPIRIAPILKHGTTSTSVSDVSYYANECPENTLGVTLNVIDNRTDDTSTVQTESSTVSE